MSNMNRSFQEIEENLKSQILDQIPTPVLAVNREFDIIYINHAAEILVNVKSEDVLGKKCHTVYSTKDCNTNECCVKRAMETGEIVSIRNILIFNGNNRTMSSVAVPLKKENGDVIGGLEFVVDITEQVKYENQLIEQSQTIRQMSTPTIKLWDGVLVLPIVGVIDSMRAQFIMESMLNKIAETYSKVIILDIQGVAAVDTAVANHIIKITKATKLMGCECILSGISPAVAQTIINLGINMNNIITKTTLKDALSEAFNSLNLEVTEKI